MNLGMSDFGAATCIMPCGGVIMYTVNEDLRIYFLLKNGTGA